MERRDFLRIIGLAAATPLLVTQALALPSTVLAPELIAPVVGELSSPLPLGWIARAATRALGEALNRPYLLSPAHRIGVDGLTRQLRVTHADVRECVSVEDYMRKWIQPAARELAAHIEQANWSRFGEMALPSDIWQYSGARATSRTTGVSVRVMRSLSLFHDEPQSLWFDVVGG